VSRRASVPERRPMLASSAAQLPKGDQWSYEVKRDGYRTLAILGHYACGGAHCVNDVTRIAGETDATRPQLLRDLGIFAVHAHEAGVWMLGSHPLESPAHDTRRSNRRRSRG